MKQIFEIEHDQQNPISPEELESYIRLLSSMIKSKVSIRDITPRWTKELPKEEGWYWCKGDYKDAPICISIGHLEKWNGTMRWTSNFMEIQDNGLSLWSDRPVIMPED